MGRSLTALVGWVLLRCSYRTPPAGSSSAGVSAFLTRPQPLLQVRISGVFPLAVPSARAHSSALTRLQSYLQVRFAAALPRRSIGAGSRFGPGPAAVLPAGQDPLVTFAFLGHLLAALVPCIAFLGLHLRVAQVPTRGFLADSRAGPLRLRPEVVAFLPGADFASACFTSQVRCFACKMKSKTQTRWAVCRRRRRPAQGEGLLLLLGLLGGARGAQRTI